MGELPPLSLYIHFPWCIQKCPYCDFNSHVYRLANKNPDKTIDKDNGLPENAYLSALKRDLEQELPFVQGRKISSIFIGGGTPSLISPEIIQQIISFAKQTIGFSENIEITLEANPGASEQQRFKRYRQAGVNRISLGAQSFDNRQLKNLGRVHCVDDTYRAIEMLQQAGFDNFNLDLMFALPSQTLEQALDDLQTAIDLKPPHISWYQLTLEPNTVFYRQQPKLPDDDLQYDIMQAGHKLLAAQGYTQYETSAFSQAGKQCLHNQNYWEFGDYLGIGAGAHGKVTRISPDGFDIRRRQKTRVPKHYLKSVNPCSQDERISDKDLPAEFALNALRLSAGVPKSSFEERTGQSWSLMNNTVSQLVDKKLLQNDQKKFVTTKKGALFLNEVLQGFL